MSIVTIQLGQCGNQVGAAFFEQLSKQLLDTKADTSSSHAHARSGSSRHPPAPPPPSLTPPHERDAFQQAVASRFFRAPSRSKRAAAADSAGGPSLPIARAVLIDMEPKVIQSALAHSSSAAAAAPFRYDASRAFYRQSGSGNNWAHGYALHGPQCQEELLDRVRAEVEAADSLGGLLLLQSLAGGTGSGVGAYLTELLSDFYPEHSRLNAVVWPYRNGEVIVQNYNALLTLSTLIEVSDGIVLFENDSLHQICSKRLAMQTTSFTEMNRIIAESLGSLVAPAVITQAQPFYAPQGEEAHSGAGSRGEQRGGGGGGSGKPKLVPPTDSSLLSRCPPLSLWSDSLTHLFPHPGFKLSTVRSIPQTSHRVKAFGSATWSYLMKHLLQMSLLGSDMEDGLDFSVKPFSKNMHMSKRRWHRHWSSSARAMLLYDTSTTFNVGATTMTLAVPPVPATATPSATSPILPQPAAPVYDAPLQPPPHLSAFLDGESYLECRLQDDQLNPSTRFPPSSTGDPDDPSPSSPASSLAHLLYLRGLNVCSADATPFTDPSLYASFSLDPLKVVRDNRSLHGDERMATLWSNGQSVVRPLDGMLQKVYDMLNVKAYVHHYMKYGLDLDLFWQHVCSMEQIHSDYQSLAYQPK